MTGAGGGAATRYQLTVSDIERLAKSGVAMKFEDIASVVVPDAAHGDQDPLGMDSWKLIKPMVERWKRVTSGDKFPCETAYAIQSNGKVYVMLVHHHGEPAIMIEDDAHLWPSEAFFAKLHLLEKVNPRPVHIDSGQPPVGAAASRRLISNPPNPVRVGDQRQVTWNNNGTALFALETWHGPIRGWVPSTATFP